MGKEQWINMHDQLAEAAMSANPDLTEEEAYNLTFDQVNEAAEDAESMRADYEYERSFDR